MNPLPCPYASSPEFDESSLPDALRKQHSTKSGTWGLLKVFEGEVTLVFEITRRKVTVTPDQPAIIPPTEPHHVETTGKMRMQIDFYRERPFEHE